MTALSLRTRGLHSEFKVSEGYRMRSCLRDGGGSYGKGWVEERASCEGKRTDLIESLAPMQNLGMATYACDPSTGGRDRPVSRAG